MSNTPRRKGATTTRKTARPRPATSQETAKRSVDWKRIGLWSLGVAVAVLLTLFIILGQPERFEFADDPNLPEAVETFEVTDRSHVQGAVAYEQDPPVGGAHNERWMACGFYDDPIPNENAVHALEHGVVWITYQPELPGGQLDTLRALALEPEVIVSPYPGLDSPIVASVWGAQLRLDSADDPDLGNFVQLLRNHSGVPEAGASCLGGIGTPSS